MENTMEMNVIETTENAMVETASKGKGVAKAVGAVALVGAVGALIWRKIKKAKMKKKVETATEVVEGEIVEEK